MHTTTARRTVPDRLRWALGSLALLAGLASLAALTHDGPWIAQPVATIGGTAAPR